jgi:hypothetical protein
VVGIAATNNGMDFFTLSTPIFGAIGNTLSLPQPITSMPYSGKRCGVGLGNHVSGRRQALYRSGRRGPSDESGRNATSPIQGEAAA